MYLVVVQGSNEGLKVVLHFRMEQSEFFTLRCIIIILRCNFCCREYVVHSNTTLLITIGFNLTWNISHN